MINEDENNQQSKNGSIDNGDNRVQCSTKENVINLDFERINDNIININNNTNNKIDTNNNTIPFNNLHNQFQSLFLPENDFSKNIYTNNNNIHLHQFKIRNYCLHKIIFESTPVNGSVSRKVFSFPMYLIVNKREKCYNQCYDNTISTDSDTNTDHSIDTNYCYNNTNYNDTSYNYKINNNNYNNTNNFTNTNINTNNSKHLRTLLYNHQFTDTPFTINPQNIKHSHTTVMLKNIPNKYNFTMLCDLLNEHHFGTYDFVYLRMDFLNECNVGYAFINFISINHLISFYYKVHNKGWSLFCSNKIAELSYASIQGIDNLYKKFKYSPILKEQKEYRPRMFWKHGVLRGMEKKDFTL